MSPSGWYPPHVDNTDTMYLGDQHDLVITSVNFCFWLVFSSVSICQLLISNKWQSYMSGKLDLGLKLNINCCFKLFKESSENLGENLWTNLFSNNHQHWRSKFPVSNNSGCSARYWDPKKIGYSHLRRVWHLWINLCHFTQRSIFKIL